MEQTIRRPVPALILICSILLYAASFQFDTEGNMVRAEGSESADASAPSGDAPTSVAEARARARMLHETLHGTLQVMHRDFFDEEDTHAIPSRSLEDVFAELARSQQVKLRWLAVNAEPLNIDHKPRNGFEQRAVKALSGGEKEYEAVADNAYWYVGSIKLASQCLKCHLPNRTSNKDRIAGLIITMPLKIPKVP